MASFDWNRLENGLYEELRGGLERFGRAHPEERVYAVALYGVDRALDGLLSLPHLALAREAGSAPPDADGFWGARFNPEDWADDTELEVSADDTLLQLERALTAEATRGTQAHWRKTEARYFRVLVRITRRLRDEAPSVICVTDDFVCYWHDEEGGPDLAAKTIPRARFARLFGSEHPVVRWHAASRLGDRSFGARVGKKILPALARGLADPDPTVRRLVVLSISYWKAAAAPYRGAIEALRQDADELVRRIVEHVLLQW